MNLTPLTMLVLFAWPLASIYFYMTRPVASATLWTIVGGALVLPVGASLKIEMIPAFDKGSIPTFAALVACILLAGTKLRPRAFGVTECLFLVFVLSPLVSSSLNGDPVIAGSMFIAGVDSYDGVSAAIAQTITFIPFYLGRQLMRTPKDTETIFRFLAIAGLVYSIPMLIEWRMSPQLHNWIYGYHPSSFVQAIRDDGYRPMIFMGHGLAASFFATTTAVAAAALWRTGAPAIWRVPAPGAVAYLSAIVALYRSVGSLIYAVFLVPLVSFAGHKLQLRIAVLLVSIGLVYPMLRTADLVPTARMTELSELFSSDRAASLEFRFINEEKMLNRALERPYFGWGRWGRGRIYDEYGRDITVSDGYWVIILGQSGLVGFAATFGLLALSVYRASASLKFSQSNHDRVLLSALALIVAISVIDLMPNAFLAPWNWLLAGALLGRAEALRSERAHSASIRSDSMRAQDQLILTRGRSR